MLSKEIQNMLDEIDERFEGSKLLNLSRLSLTWSIWSNFFTRNLREKIRGLSKEEAIPYKRVFQYWVNRSKLLQLLYDKRKGTFTEKVLIRLTNRENRLEEEGRTLRNEEKTK